MNKMIATLIAGLACMLLIGACASRKPPDRAAPEIFTPTSAQGGQLPEAVARQASRDHGGAMPDLPATPAAGEGGSTAAVRGGLTVVLGPINAEQLDRIADGAADAGQSIREIISQKLTAGNAVTLFDAPEERFIDDSPRPDLAQKGVRFVIKGVVSGSTVSQEITVFLRAVNTTSGKVALVASARNDSRNQAAVDAAERLLQKLKGSEP